MARGYRPALRASGKRVLMRQVAIGAVVAFVLTVIALSVWKPTAGEVTPASPPPSSQQVVEPQNGVRSANTPIPFRARNELRIKRTPFVGGEGFVPPSIRALSVDAGMP